MDLSLPQEVCNDGSICCGGMAGWRNLTILIGENNKVVTYLGLVQYPIEKPKTFISGSKALSNEIFNVNEFVKERVENPDREGLFEMSINKVRGYVVDDRINQDEQKLLEENKL